jgi:NTE family protein
VLSGGGVLGALQVGMLRALLEHRIQPDLVLGCSVGALNGVAIAADPTLTMVGRLQETWLDLEGRDVLPAGLLPTTVQLARKGEAVHGNAGLRAVLEEILPVETFAELAVPFQCVATDIAAAREVWFSSGTLVEPILASAALPAMLPPVEIDGVRHIDGAVVNDVPVTRAVDLGATTIYILHVGGFDRPRPEPKRPFDMALQAYWIARRARFRRDMAALPADVEAILLPVGEAASGRFNDFRRSDALMASAYRATDALLTARSEGADGQDGPAPAPPRETAEGADGGGFVTLSGK